MAESDGHPDDANRNVRPGLRSHIFVVTMQVLMLCASLGASWGSYWRRTEEGVKVAAAVGMLGILGTLVSLLFVTLTRDWRWRWGISWPIRGRGIAQPGDGHVGGEELLLVSCLAGFALHMAQYPLYGIIVWLCTGTLPSPVSWISLVVWGVMVGSMGYAVVGTLRRLPERKNYGETFE